MAVMQEKRQQVLTVATDRLNAVKAKLELGKGEIAKIAGKLVTPEELIRFTLNAILKNPKLLDCFDTREGTASVFLSIITSRIMDIPCDGIHGYLVPFNDNQKNAVICQFMPGYKGFVQLALRNPKVASINAAAVYEHDEFEFEYGTQKFLRHKPVNGDRGKVIWAYAIWENDQGRSDFRVLTHDDIERRRNVSKSKNKGPWVDWYAEMAAKTALLALAKVAPLGANVAVAAKIDDRIESGGTLSAKELAEYAEGEPDAMPRNIPHEESVPQSFDAKREECESAIKNAKTPPKNNQRQPETPLSRLLQRVSESTNNAMLEDIGNDAKDMMERGEMANDEVKQIHDAIKQVGDLDK